MHWDGERIKWTVAAAIASVTTKGVNCRWYDKEYGNDTRKLDVFIQDYEVNSKEVLARMAEEIFKAFEKLESGYVDYVQVISPVGVWGKHSRKK